MSGKNPGRIDRDGALIWLACLLALAAGAYVGWFRLGAQIDAQLDLRAQAAALERADAAIVAARPQLEQTEHELDATAERFQLGADHPATVARFLSAAARIAEAHRIALIAVDERPPLSAQTPLARDPQMAATPTPFEDISLEIALHGSYRELLGTLRDLARAPIAVQIDVAAIERDATDEPGRDAPLTAHLHVVLERLATPTVGVAAAGALDPELTRAR